MAEQTLPNHEGQNVPEVTFRLRRRGEWATVTTDELFRGKNVIVFSLPGAFTPTCSSTHLPRYNELAPVFRDQGIDTIICVAVNDPFVMEEWGKSQECDNVFLLPDGNGVFTEAMGLLVDKSDLNFGKRSWRYSMLVRDKLSASSAHTYEFNLHAPAPIVAANASNVSVAANGQSVCVRSLGAGADSQRAKASCSRSSPARPPVDSVATIV